MLEYETANPGADFDEKEAEVFHFDEDNTARGSEIERPNIALQPTPGDLESGVSPKVSPVNSRAGTGIGNGPAMGNGPVTTEPDLGSNHREPERV